MIRFRLLTAVLVLAASAMASDKSAADRMANMTTEKWREDIRFYRDQMPKVHGNLFHSMTREQFESSIDQLERRLPQMSSDQVSTEILRLVAMVNDGHTHVRFGTLGHHQLPIRLYYFADGLYVISGEKPYADIVGGKVKRIGRLSAEEAYAAVRPLISVDKNNEFHRKLVAPELLTDAEVLKSVNAVTDMKSVEVVVEKKGTDVSTKIPPTESAHLFDAHAWPADPDSWVSARGASPSENPLWLRHTEKNYWHEYLPDGKTLYIQYNAVQDQPGAEPIAKYFPRVLKEAEVRKVERVVLDMRLNGGGNNFLNRPIWHAILKNDRLNQNGRFWVIIGRKTFSAAMNCVDDLELNTNALFAGEPTGETPNMWGDARAIELPNSGIVIQASTLWWQLEDPRDTRDFRAPDVAAELTFADYANNVDPVMEEINKAQNVKSLPTLLRDIADSGDVKRIAPAARNYFADPRFRYASVETQINNLGYELMGEGKLDAAVEVLKVNTERYPHSWNTWDSLGEACMKHGDKEAAIRNYQKSLELNPQNSPAREAIAKMKGGQ